MPTYRQGNRRAYPAGRVWVGAQQCCAPTGPTGPCACGETRLHRQDRTRPAMSFPDRWQQLSVRSSPSPLEASTSSGLAMVRPFGNETTTSTSFGTRCPWSASARTFLPTQETGRRILRIRQQGHWWPVEERQAHIRKGAATRAGRRRSSTVTRRRRHRSAAAQQRCTNLCAPKVGFSLVTSPRNRHPQAAIMPAGRLACYLAPPCATCAPTS